MRYVICGAVKELRDVFWNVFFRAPEIWPKALPDALPSFHVLVLKSISGVVFACLQQIQAAVHSACWLGKSAKFWRIFKFFEIGII